MTKSVAVVPGPGTAIDQTEETILRIVREVLGKAGLGVDDDLFDHGATSLSFVRVLAQINQRFQVTVHPADLLEATTRCLARNVAAELSRPVVKSMGA